MADSGQLLRNYAERHDERAFGEIVKRYLDLVYSTALRQGSGDTHLAQDIAHIVFMALARKAKALPRNVVLSGWLYRHTCFTAATKRGGKSRLCWMER
jgi:DNA-directed RNA polymerase specialized sigma24 family protein